MPIKSAYHHNFRENVLAMIKAHGVSRQEFASHCGISRQSLWLLLRGDSVTLGISARIAIALDIPFADLIGNQRRFKKKHLTTA